jgi:hypothetical protein
VLGRRGDHVRPPVDKYLRDATSFLRSDGTNQLCLLRAARARTDAGAQETFGF